MRVRLFLPLVLVLFFACTQRSASDVPIVKRERPLTSCRPVHVSPAVRLINAFDAVTFDLPLTVGRAGDAFLVGEQRGTIRRVFRDGDAWRSDLFLDIAAKLAPPHYEGGLIGVAASPDYATTGEVFVAYTGISDQALFRTVVARFTSRDGLTLDPASEEAVLTIERDQEGHNGGRLVFGPDRMLYIAIGDGSWEDPLRRARNPNELFGKMLRIDPLGGRPYVSPPDNPYAAGGGRPEVFAMGFRNPWSFSFDDAGRLWLGDVGHVRWEEIDIVVKGGDYGWPNHEGRHCFLKDECDAPGALDPVFEYPHVDGYAVTGGIMYRGTRLGLGREYIFGDFVTGRVWALDPEHPENVHLVVDTGVSLAGFAEDDDKEPLVIDIAGKVLRLEPAAATSRDEVTLAQLGCLDAARPGEMERGLVPYEVNSPLWSDGLDKRRWFTIPADKTIHPTDEGKLTMPTGTMLLKEFSHRGRRIETRMFVRDAEFGWEGYTFEWNASQTDAVLVDDAKTVDVDGIPWTIPSRSQCFACHVANVDRVLGFEVAQLNRGTQLAELSDMGFFDAPLAAPAPALVDPSDVTAPIEARARSYLHANCSFCHGALGAIQGLPDLRAELPLASMNVVCRDVNFFASDSQLPGLHALVQPGDPTGSLLVTRMGRRDALRMPPLGGTVVDTAAVDLVSSWIGSIQNCP